MGEGIYILREEEKRERYVTYIITLLTESHFGITHALMISLGCGLAQSEGFTISLFCLQ